MKIILLILISIIFLGVLGDCVIIPPALSLLLPGGGQIYNKAYIKGAIISITEMGLVYYLYDYYQNHNDLNDNAIKFLIGIKAFSVIDAYIDAELKEKSVKAKWKSNINKK